MRKISRVMALLFFMAASSLFAYQSHASPALEETVQGVDGGTAVTGTITFTADYGAATDINPLLLGTNLPAWLASSGFTNSTFRARAQAAGINLIRMPGGSWSNAYDWLACERAGVGIDGNAVCWWTWASRPTDFINFIKAVGGQGIYTINQAGTSKEAAALVAFFNGSVTDTRVIGIDVRGRDWGRVSDWAQLRTNNGNPTPLNVKYWEIGNETYGGNSGKDCWDWGWENDVWTCDGTEYVNGIGSGTNRKEGYLEFRTAMKAVDPTIMVGAVGVSSQSSWSNWGNEVIAAAGSVMDFYIVHQYAFDNLPGSYQDALAQPQTAWQPVMANINAAFDQYAGGRRVPIAVTEHNLIAIQDNDYNQWMTRGVNMLFMADTIGQQMKYGFAMANQWDLGNGWAGSGTEYGLMWPQDNFTRSPQYYVFPLWSRFGHKMLSVSSTYNAATTLSVYAGMTDPFTATVLAINKTDTAQTANIQINGAPSLLLGGTVDTVKASSLGAQETGITYNGVNNMSVANNLSNASSTQVAAFSNPVTYTFEPYSVTLLRIGLEEFVATDWVYLPVTIR